MPVSEKYGPDALAGVRVLWMQPGTLTLWGISYQMREGQSPTDLWRGRTVPDALAQSRGWHGATHPSPGPREGWTYLGEPGWFYGSSEDAAAVRAFLAPMRAAKLVPGNPYEWTDLALDAV